jgi:hypothetical protein
MHEIWLQKYIKQYYQQIGFTELHGPYNYGADFKGVYAGKRVKVEAEWDYSDYVSHKHTLKFADILVVASLEPVPENLKTKLPSIIIHLNRDQVVEWARPRSFKKNNEDFYSYTWRRLSRNLLYLYAYYRKRSNRKGDFIGSNLVLTMYKTQKPAGFQFGEGGREESFDGLPEDKALWDFWLNAAHAVADQFRLKPALLRPTWIDMVALYLNHTGRIRDKEFQRFQEVATFINDLILRQDDQDII